CSASITGAIATNPGGGRLLGTTTVAAGSGDVTFSDLSIDKVGTGYTLTAASAPLAGATSTAFNISPAAATKLAFTAQPANEIAEVGRAPWRGGGVRAGVNKTVTRSTGSISVAIRPNTA